MATDVNKYIGIPHYFNTSSFRKCDCLGLIKLFYREHGWPQTFDDGLPIESEEYLNDCTKVHAVVPVAVVEQFKKYTR